jgi:hypothetical protein
MVELHGHAPFLPRPHPAPVAATLYDRYQVALGPASLVYAALTALITRLAPANGHESYVLR